MKIERSGSLVRGTAEAPHGKVWRAGRVHELVAEGRGGAEVTRAVRVDLQERMALGLMDCTHDDCDWCNDY